MNLTDITSGSGDLAIDHIQELRGYVMRGSPVLLSPQAAAYALSCIESNGLINTERDELRAENARLREALAAAPRWVPVAERLPEIYLTVPVKLSGGHIGYGAYNGAAWVPFINWRDNVTHWLELPPAPEAER